MKVAALSPQFVVEAPQSVESTEAKRATADLHLKLVRPEEPQPSSATLNQETRDGLRRLSRLIQEKKKDGGNKEKKSGGERDDRHRKRAFQLYQFVLKAEDPREHKGQGLNKYL